MKKIAIIGLLLFSGCLQGPKVEIANWPYGYKSAVCPTFETELAGAEELANVAVALGSRNATFFLVAGYFQDNSRDLEWVRNYEISNMGWNQKEWMGVVPGERIQLGEIKKAHDWLQERGFSPTGFRAPLLKVNKATLNALKKIGYKYDSSACCGGLPYFIDGIVEIPVSLNFDIYWSDNSMKYSLLPAYVALQDSYEKDGLFTFYAHVDTASNNIENLTKLLDYIGTRNIWIASGGEISDWWLSKRDLNLSVKGKRISVENSGTHDIDGVTVKIKPKKTVKGAIYLAEDEEALYVVMPTIKAGGTASVRTE